MNDNLSHEISSSENKKKSLISEENKIINLENRLMGPNNEGKYPTEAEPLNENELENIKNKILFKNENIITNNNNINQSEDNQNSDSSNKDKSNKSSGNYKKKKEKDNSINKNLYEYLSQKRQRENNSNLNTNNKNNNNYANNYTSNNNSNQNNLNFNNNNNEHYHQQYYNNNLINSEIFSSKNCTVQNHLFTPSNLKNKTIHDYYSSSSTMQNKQSVNNHNHCASENNNLINKLDFSCNKNENHIEKNNIYDEFYIKNNNQNLLSELKDKDKLIRDKEKYIEKLTQELKEAKELNDELAEYNKSYELEIKRCRYDICVFVKEIEEYKRQNKKRYLHDQEFKIGKIGLQRVSHGQLFDYWEDGEEMANIKKQLEDIKKEKEDLEKQKKKLSYTKSKKNSDKNNNNNNSNLLNSSNSNSNLFPNSSNNVDGYIDETEQHQDLKDLLLFKWNNLSREENELKEKKDKLDIEKSVLIHDLNLLNQESKCTFIKAKGGFPLLAGRYQIIGLLGKGGYSEVYKAYDVENHINVACKLHQLNPNWKEEIKDNYIKHTIRENQIHKEINHPKIVKHYDTIEIDNNSFCTVLEYCTGPDLGAYLQKNKIISEKEARIIINQILLGLEYLNNLPNKIIHYDLKPENIIFNYMEVKISDFGLAKIIDANKDNVQLTSQGVGTYWYLPPECFEENSNVNISNKVDIWSIGVILYEMFYRKKPFGQNYTQDKLIKDKIMNNARKVEFPNKPIISEECKDFIKNCLAFRQEDRYDVVQALNSSFIKHESNNNKNK